MELHLLLAPAVGSSALADGVVSGASVGVRTGATDGADGLVGEYTVGLYVPPGFVVGVEGVPGSVGIDGSDGVVGE